MAARCRPYTLSCVYGLAGRRITLRFWSRSGVHKPLRSWRWFPVLGASVCTCQGAAGCIPFRRGIAYCYHTHCTIIVPQSQVLYSYFRYYFYPPHTVVTLDIATLQAFVDICRKLFRYFLKKVFARNIKKHPYWCFGFGL